jgi:hypothetical protein
MERIIYQAKVDTAPIAFFIVLLHLLFIAIAVNDDSFTIQDDYPSVLGFLFIIWFISITNLKKFILTENEFIVEHSLIAFIIKPKRIPLNDIQKLVFKQVRGQSVPFIEIYRISKGEIPNFHLFTSREPKRYYFMMNSDYIRKLINAFKSEGVQVECIGPVWK